jgi:hypothetical protein
MIIQQFSPELLTEIFGNLYINDLLACALVNRKWSANAMRILWKCPIQLATFPLKNTKSPQEKLCSIISTIVKCLSIEVKNKLRNVYGIIIDETKNESVPMFDYCLFMEKLNFVIMFKATLFWLNSLGCVTGKNLFLKELNELNELNDIIYIYIYFFNRINLSSYYISRNL